MVANREDELMRLRTSMDALSRMFTSRTLMSLYSRAADVYVSQPGYMLLVAIKGAQDLSLVELARLTGMDQAATGRQVKKLAEDGYVNRTLSSSDARMTTVDLTDTGVAAVNRLIDVGLDQLRRTLASWSAADRTKFINLFELFLHDVSATPYRKFDEIVSSECA